MKNKRFLLTLMLIVSGCSRDIVDITSLNPKRVKSVLIENIDLDIPLKKISINQDTKIAEFCRIMSSSKLVKFDDINIKAGKGYCIIELRIDNSDCKFIYVLTNYSGGIIQLEGTTVYRNDSLINFLNKESFNLGSTTK